MDVKPYERVITLNDERLLKLVKEKEELTLKGRELHKEATELENAHAAKVEELRKVADKVQGIQRNVINRVQKVADKELGEYELPMTTSLVDGDVKLLISNAVDEFKSRFVGFNKYKQPYPKKK